MKIVDGPRTPHWVQKVQYMNNPTSYLESNYQRYGDVFHAPIVTNAKQQLLLSHPEALQRIFTKEDKEFYVPGSDTVRILVGDYSVVSLEGKAHLKERKLLLAPFQREDISAYGRAICKITEEVFDPLTPGTTFSARNLFSKISGKVILKVVFGIDNEERFEQLEHLIHDLLEALTSPLIVSTFFFPFLRKDLGPKSPWGYFRRLQQKIDQLLYAEIRDRRAQQDPNRTDILTLLVSATDEEGNGMSDRQLHDELLTLLLGAYETTASAMSWALYWLHEFPETLEKLLQELDTLGDRPDTMTVFKLPYLTAACNEALRIYPGSTVTDQRNVIKPIELMGYHLEPGTQVYGCIYLTHHREDLYPEPKKFKPERFLERKYTPYEFLPFGGGSRRCIGENLALLEIKLVLATVLSKYRLALVENQSVKPELIGPRTLLPSTGVQMVFKEKRKTLISVWALV